MAKTTLHTMQRGKNCTFDDCCRRQLQRSSIGWRLRTRRTAVLGRRTPRCVVEHERRLGPKLWRGTDRC